MLEAFEDLPSWKSMFMAALGGSQTPFLADQSPNIQQPIFGISKSCPNPSLSCHNKGYAVQDTCCTNYPGGQFALTQFWNSDPYAGPPGYLGPNNTWTIHGLWPDHCDGHFDSVCDCDRSGDCSSYNRKCKYSTCNKDYSSITNIFEKFGETELLEYMGDHWKGINGDEHLWQHEWSKHGTCVSTLEPKCYENYTATQEVVQYFHKAVELYQSLPSFEWLAAANITPSTTEVYTRDQIKAALKAPRGFEAIIQCDHYHPFELREIWYHFLVRGSLQDGEFVAIDPDMSGVGGVKDSCPETGIRYLPKGERAGPQPTTTGSSPPGPTGEPSGKGQLIIKMDNGGQRGCLISNGKWYNTRVGSSCATFRIHRTFSGRSAADESFTLRSSKGPCGISVADSTFSCGRTSPSTSFKIVDGALLPVDEKDTASWSADAVPHGTEQEEIHLSDDGDAHFKVMWKSS